MKISELVRVTRGKLISGDPDIDIDPSEISTDSRKIRAGELFMALKGENFDGNRFVGTAFEKGAIGAIVSQYTIHNTQYEKIVIKVKDTTRALADIAFSCRMKFDIPVIGVTGSNGKTTVKEMISDILSTKYGVLKNEGTKNNHIGLPQTLFNLSECHDICVLELGTNHKDEIKNLCKIARPNVAVITNIGPSHLEFFGNLKGVYGAKKEILDSLDGATGGIAVLNGDDEFLSKVKRGRFKIIRFGLKRKNDFRAKIQSIQKNRVRFLLNDEEPFELNLLGLHNVYNALAAITVAAQFNIDYKSMKRALFNYRPVDMRLELEEVSGIDIINDSYNSNPLSVKTALDAIKYYPARNKWVVCGDMLELGRGEARFHRMVGESIAKSDISGLVTFGKLSRNILFGARQGGMNKDCLWHCTNHADIARILKKLVRRGDVVLLKGSRGMRMEEVLNKLKTNN